MTDECREDEQKPLRSLREEENEQRDVGVEEDSPGVGNCKCWVRAASGDTSYVFGLGCGYVMGVAGDEPGERSRGQEERADVSG